MITTPVDNNVHALAIEGTFDSGNNHTPWSAALLRG